MTLFANETKFGVLYIMLLIQLCFVGLKLKFNTTLERTLNLGLPYKANMFRNEHVQTGLT